MSAPSTSAIGALLREPASTAWARADALARRELPRGTDAVVLCGAGFLGRAMLRELRRAGTAPLAFADNSPALHGAAVDGVRVMPVADAVAEFPDAAFVTTVYNPSAIAAQLASLGVTPASSRALLLALPGVPRAHAAMGGPDAVLADAERASEAANVWADDESRAEYEHQLRWQLLLDPERRPHAPPAETYFAPDLVRLGSRERFADCGAFDGDSLRAFLAQVRDEFAQIDAIEPDPRNREKLAEWLGGLEPSIRERIRVHPVAAAARRGTLRFEADAGAGSTVTSGGATEVEGAPLDELLGDAPPSLIKVDVEGAELDVIAGARAIIAEHAPTLALVLYHRASDLWTVPLALRAIRPDYRLYLRRYAEDCWETVCYALPPSRAAA